MCDGVCPFLRALICIRVLIACFWLCAYPCMWEPDGVCVCVSASMSVVSVCVCFVVSMYVCSCRQSVCACFYAICVCSCSRMR